MSKTNVTTRATKSTRKASAPKKARTEITDEQLVFYVRTVVRPVLAERLEAIVRSALARGDKATIDEVIASMHALAQRAHEEGVAERLMWEAFHFAKGGAPDEAGILRRNHNRLAKAVA